MSLPRPRFGDRSPFGDRPIFGDRPPRPFADRPSNSESSRLGIDYRA